MITHNTAAWTRSKLSQTTLSNPSSQLEVNSTSLSTKKYLQNSLFCQNMPTCAYSKNFGSFLRRQFKENFVESTYGSQMWSALDIILSKITFLPW